MQMMSSPRAPRKRRAAATGTVQDKFMKRKFMRSSHSLKSTFPNGMRFLTDLLLLYMSEEDAFWLLAELLKGEVHAPMEGLYMAKGDEEIEIRVHVRVQKSKGCILDCAEIMEIVVKKGLWYSYGDLREETKLYST
ncbi:DNA repair protein recA-like protein 1 [Cucumis melo var. makuwa]|uniref:DNA repair protein recA-like protein 1 n=1 Tax=Cucumis melo var. makuwa TaxID=1194695 RepID=A0A5A7T9C6_CUCMM|nr:DNA repair protein recA-like protein 1 [Cucumis melo var. makuwa]